MNELTQEAESPPKGIDQNSMRQQLISLLEQLQGVELLEYHDMSWLDLDPAKRASRKIIIMNKMREILTKYSLD